MPSFGSAPGSPSSGFFPTGVSSPNAFSMFGQNPRDTHAMYAAYSASSSSSSVSSSGPRKAAQGQKGLRRLAFWSS